VAEARYRVAEREDYEPRLDAKHSGQADPGYPNTDRAVEALSHAVALEQRARDALEDFTHEPVPAQQEALA
jgi:hypothetical protein